MSKVKAILEETSRKREAQNTIAAKYAKQIDDLETAAQEEASQFPVSITEDVVERLHIIATKGPITENGGTMIFDDPDIKWYLHHYGDAGPEHRKLREEFNEGMEKARNAKGIALCMFSFTQEEAKALLAELE